MTHKKRGIYLVQGQLVIADSGLDARKKLGVALKGKISIYNLTQKMIDLCHLHLGVKTFFKPETVIDKDEFDHLVDRHFSQGNEISGLQVQLKDALETIDDLNATKIDLLNQIDGLKSKAFEFDAKKYAHDIAAKQVNNTKAFLSGKDIGRKDMTISELQNPPPRLIATVEDFSLDHAPMREKTELCRQYGRNVEALFKQGLSFFDIARKINRELGTSKMDVRTVSNIADELGLTGTGMVA